MLVWYVHFLLFFPERESVTFIRFSGSFVRAKQVFLECWQIISFWHYHCSQSVFSQAHWWAQFQTGEDASQSWRNRGGEKVALEINWVTMLYNRKKNCIGEITIKKKKLTLRVPTVEQWVKDLALTAIAWITAEVQVWSPTQQTQWVKDPPLPQLWCRLQLQIGFNPWPEELPYASTNCSRLRIEPIALQRPEAPYLDS